MRIVPYKLFLLHLYHSHSFYMYLNKVTGAILYITPVTLSVIDQRYLLLTIYPLALLSAIQEGYLIIKGHTTIL